MTKEEHHIDKELFTAIAAGDEAAFARLFHRYAPVLHAYAMGMVKVEALATEIVQDVFLRVWQKRETLPEIDQPSSWLYRIATNRALTHFRKQQLELRMLKAVGRKQADHAESLDDTLDAREMNRLIRGAVDQLPAQRKKIFTLIREQGLSRREVAEILGISENTVKNQLSIAVKTVQDYILGHTGVYLPVILLVMLNIAHG